MLIPFKTLLTKYGIKPEGVLHIGSNLGQECKVYHANGVKKQIHIEAIPEIFEQLQKNVAVYPNVRCINACIDETGGRDVIFNLSSNNGESSSMHEPHQHKTLHPEIKFERHAVYKTVRIDELLTKEDLAGIDFINLDVQGNELSALKSMGTLLDQINVVYTEVNSSEVYKDIPLFPEVTKWMEYKGFEMKEVRWFTDADNKPAWGDALYLRKQIN